MCCRLFVCADASGWANLWRSMEPLATRNRESALQPEEAYDDSELVRRAQADDKDAFAAIVHNVCALIRTGPELSAIAVSSDSLFIRPAKNANRMHYART